MIMRMKLLLAALTTVSAVAAASSLEVSHPHLVGDDRALQQQPNNATNGNNNGNGNNGNNNRNNSTNGNNNGNDTAAEEPEVSDPLEPPNDEGGDAPAANATAPSAPEGEEPDAAANATDTAAAATPVPNATLFTPVVEANNTAEVDADDNATSTAPDNSTETNSTTAPAATTAEQPEEVDEECPVVVTPDDVAAYLVDYPNAATTWQADAAAAVHQPVCGNEGAFASLGTNDTMTNATPAYFTTDRVESYWHNVEAYGTLCECVETNLTETCLDDANADNAADFASAAKLLFGGRSYSYRCTNQFPTCLDPDYEEKRAWYYRRGLLESHRSQTVTRMGEATTATPTTNGTTAANDTAAVSTNGAGDGSLTIVFTTKEEMCFTYTEEAPDPDDNDIGDGSGKVCWTYESNDNGYGNAAADVTNECSISFNGVMCYSCDVLPMMVNRENKDNAGAVTATLMAQCFTANCTNINDDAILENCPGLEVDEATGAIVDPAALKADEREGFVGPFRVLEDFEAAFKWESCNATSPESGAAVMTGGMVGFTFASALLLAMVIH